VAHYPNLDGSSAGESVNETAIRLKMPMLLKKSEDGNCLMAPPASMPRVARAGSAGPSR
jgi:hypothetical protein